MILAIKAFPHQKQLVLFLAQQLSQENLGPEPRR
jgi:hypothetical protein